MWVFWPKGKLFIYSMNFMTWPKKGLNYIFGTCTISLIIIHFLHHYCIKCRLICRKLGMVMVGPVCKYRWICRKLEQPHQLMQTFHLFCIKNYFFYFTNSFLQNTSISLSIIHIYSIKYSFFIIFYYFLTHYPYLEHTQYY